MKKMISVRASETMVKEAERLAKIARVDKSIVLREALEKGMEKIKVETSIKLFIENKLSLQEAANIAGISAGEMMDILRQNGIDSKIELEDLRGSLERAQKIIR